MRQRRAASALCLVLLLAGCEPRGTTRVLPAPQPQTDAALDHLLHLMRQRLLLMHDVARVKWNTRQTITDAERERVLLDAVAEQGRSHGLAPAWTRAFFAAQIEAGKRVQEADLERWRAESQAVFPDARTLTSLRLQLDRLSGDLLSALAGVEAWRGEGAFAGRLAERARVLLVGEGIDEAVRRTATGPLVGEEGCKE
jgi:chorismate mutase